jgi:hypothetical protein
MAAKTRPKSRILAAVHATARDLRSAGFIDKRRMRASSPPTSTAD